MCKKQITRKKIYWPTPMTNSVETNSVKQTCTGLSLFFRQINFYSRKSVFWMKIGWCLKQLYHMPQAIFIELRFLTGFRFKLHILPCIFDPPLAIFLPPQLFVPLLKLHRRLRAWEIALCKIAKMRPEKTSKSKAGGQPSSSEGCSYHYEAIELEVNFSNSWFAVSRMAHSYPLDFKAICCSGRHFWKNWRPFI